MASPYTYEQMVARQKALGPTGPAGPIGSADRAPADPVLDAPALEPEGADADTGSVAPPAAAPDTTASVTPVKPDVNRAKRAVVLNALRNSAAGVAMFAKHVRDNYHMGSDFKASDQEVLQAGYDIQRDSVPDLSPQEYEKAIHDEFGDRVDKKLLKQGSIDYPGHTDEPSLIDAMYKAKIGKEEAGPITYEDKAQIVARHFPEGHNSGMEPDKYLRMRYDVLKKQGNKVGSYDDWLHSQMAPTLWDRFVASPGAIGNMLLEQGKQLGATVHEATTPGALASDAMLATQMGDTPAGQDAKERLQQAGKGAVTAGSLALGGLVGPGLGAAETALGVAKTAPALAGALEGAVAGGVQGGGNAAIDQKTPGEVAQEAATGAGIGAGLGAAGGAVAQRAEGLADKARAAASAKTVAAARTEIAVDRAAQNEIAAQAKAAQQAADAAEAARVAEASKPVSLAPSKYEQALEKFAREHGTTLEEARQMVEAGASGPPIPDTATVGEMRNLRKLAADAADARAAETPPATPLPSAEPAATPSAESPSAPPSGESVPGSSPPAAAPSAPADRGIVQNDVVDRLTQGINAAQAQLGERTRLRRQALSQRFAAGESAAKAAGGGLKGFHARLAAMAGEIQKPDWEGVKGAFTESEIDNLFTTLDKSNLTAGDKLTAGNGLKRLLGLRGVKGGAPTGSQLRAMRTAFGSDFVEAVVQNPTLAQKLKGMWDKTINTPRTLQTTLDLSMGGRQGYLMASQPEYRQAWGTMVRAFGDTKVADDIAATIKADPLYNTMRESGLHFQGDAFGTKSEQFPGSWVDSWVGVKNSQAAADAFLNKLRADTFRRYYGDLARAGLDMQDPHVTQSLAKWLNTSTGRGGSATFARDANLLNAVMFSPRLFYSRLETFNPRYYASLHPAIRAQALKSNMSVIGGTMGLLGLAGMSGVAKVNMDPRNADFAKAKIGNTRIDLFAGHQQIARFVAQMLTGKVVSSTTGREIDLAGSDKTNGFQRGAMTRLDVLGRFFENKTSPIASLAISLMRGTDFTGAPISVPNEVVSRFTPMVIQDIADAYADSGIPKAAVVAPLALAGVGTQTYEPSLPGQKEVQGGVVYNAGKWLWDQLNGNAPDDPAKAKLDAHLAEQWAKDAAMAQVFAHHEATLVPGFFDKGFDQKAEIRKATSRRMARVNKLYKRLATEGKDYMDPAIIRERASVTGMDPDALKNPNVYSEIEKQ